MESRTQERVEQWDSRPFSGGYAALSDLATDGFSGAVSAAGTWLFMLNGRVVGVFDGDIEDYESATGTVYEAPHPALPLLCSMEEQGGETRAKYYTNETPLEEVDETLQDGAFTGYVELSENVLSGDYYAVYYGGRRMAAAYIGNAERLLTGDEAFERAADEVGIYEVVDVDIEVTDVPGSNDDATRSSQSDADAGTEDRPGSASDSAASSVEPIDISGANATDGDSRDVTDDAESDPAEGITVDDASPSDPEPAGITASSGESADGADPVGEEDAGEEAGRAATSNDAVAATDGAAVSSEGATGTGSTLDPDEVEAAAAELDRSDISWTEDDVDEPTADDEAAAPEPPDPDGQSEASAPGDQSEKSDLEEQFEEEEQWRETRSIPSIDPEKTSDDSTDRSSGSAARKRRTRRSPSGRATAESAAVQEARAKAAGASSADRAPRRSKSGNRTPSGSAETDDAESGSDHPIDRLKRRIERLEERREELLERAERLEGERDRLRSENQELTAKVDRLEQRVEELEAELERAREAEGASETAAGDRISADRALSGTNLFVRYRSKSEPTLQLAHEGAADSQEVAANLRLEHHTEFDASAVTVEGNPFEEFLSSTLVYQFVDWLTEVLLYEIRDTGHADGLADLYDAIPRIDRIELGGSISLEDDDTEDVPDRVDFDVVAYDKMGNPLVVVTMNDSRRPADETMLTDLEAAASAVKANYPELSAAMAVTASYFDPGALEVTERATSSGFLSRGSKESYVNVSRKRGYHLCLVESQSEGFHMTVPEL